MRYHAALVLLMSLAAVSATESTSKPGTPGPPTSPSPPSKPGSPSPPTSPPTTPSKPGTPGPPSGGGKGDPIMTGFDGRSFEFFGQAGSFYNVLSEKSHQLSMKLKEGQMWDHQGSYMTALGFQYQEHTVVVENVGDALEVTLDGEKIVLKADQTEAEHILGMANGELSLLWQLHRAELGNAVEITTDMLSLTAWVTPAGTRDEGGKVQPAYLNFDLALLASPAHNALEGIVGRTFNAPKEAEDFKFHGVEAEYEMASFFPAAHPKSLFGQAKAGGLQRSRKLIESGATLAFPMRAVYA